MTPGADDRDDDGDEPAAVPAWFADAHRPPLRITGRVVHAGQPVAGARVVLTSYLTLAGLRAPVATITGADGSFDLGEHVATTYDVTATADGLGWGHGRLAPDDPHRAGERGPLLIALSGCDHVVAGTVRDASGGPIVGATIAPARGGGADATPLAAAAITDAAGTFALCTRAGWLQLIVRAAGYGGVMLTEIVHGRRRLDVALIPEATIVGRVVRADDGTPVAGARVWLRAEAYPGTIAASPDIAAADADGQFRITGVAPGRHMVAAETDALLWTFAPVVVMPGEESPAIELRLPEAVATVRGTVREAGQPVPGARVAVMMFGLRRSAVAADADGGFVLRLRQPGRTGFAVDGYEVLAPLELDPADAPGAPIVVEVARLGSIAGQVTVGGAPAWQGAVVATGLPLASPVRTAIRADGGFELLGLPAGRYTLTAQSDAAEAFTSDAAAVVVELPARAHRRGVQLALDGRGEIAGEVRDQHGAPVPDVLVTYVRDHGDDLCRARTDDDGRFACTALAGGGRYHPTVTAVTTLTLVLAAADAGGLPPLQVPDGDARLGGVVLRVRAPRASLRGRVVDADGHPRADVAVRAIEAASGLAPATAPWLGEGVAVTDGAGRFALPAWADARYVIHARDPGGGEGVSAELTAGIDGVDDVEVVLVAAGRLHGELRGFTGRPTVTVRAIGNPFDAVFARVDGDVVTATGLPPGRYGVMASAGTEGASATVEITAGGDAAVVLEARATVRLTGRVVDARSGQPVAGARCFVGPTIAGAGLFAQGAGAAPTDADGRFVLDVSGGSVEVGCLPHLGRHSEGAAWRDVGAGGAATIEVAVITTADARGRPARRARW